MNNTAILFLTYNDEADENILMQAINKSSFVNNACVFKAGTNKVQRLFRKFSVQTEQPFISHWLSDTWFNRIEEYKIIVVTASQYTPHLLHWIHKRYPRIRLINYYWDQIHVSRYPVEQSSDFENWSFNEDDCQKYSMKYNPQIYSKFIDVRNDNCEYEASFIGADREGLWPERIETVNHLYSIMSLANMKVFFYLVTDSKNAHEDIRHKERLSEREYLNIVRKSKAIVDVSEWLTLRPLLALTNGKKVITNYRVVL